MTGPVGRLARGDRLYLPAPGTDLRPSVWPEAVIAGPCGNLSTVRLPTLLMTALLSALGIRHRSAATGEGNLAHGALCRATRHEPGPGAVGRLTMQHGAR